MTGVEDLERYGQFEDTPDYGQVWFPRDLDPDWAPYKYGHWAFVNPWGWTWIDDQPWGFAPFHYGRWAQVDGRWGWIAGRSVSEPVYAPALVAFIGGGGWSASMGAGETTGWVALGARRGLSKSPTIEVSETYASQLKRSQRQPECDQQLLFGGARGANSRRISSDNARAAVVVRSATFAREQTRCSARSRQCRRRPLGRHRRWLAASRPAPTLEARAGVGGRAPQGGLGPKGGSVTAPPPPSNLEAVRRAVVTPSGQQFRPAGDRRSDCGAPQGRAGAFVAPRNCATQTPRRVEHRR